MQTDHHRPHRILRTFLALATAAALTIAVRAAPHGPRLIVILVVDQFTAGEYREAASPADIAPTLAFLAGITLPRAQGRVLVEALAR